MLSSFMLMNAQARSTGLLGLSALPRVNDFIKLSELLLSCLYMLKLLIDLRE